MLRCFFSTANSQKVVPTLFVSLWRYNRNTQALRPLDYSLLEQTGRDGDKTSAKKREETRGKKKSGVGL